MHVSRLAVSALIFASLIVNVSALEKKFTISDHINKSWSQELVHYDLSFAPGECRLQEWRLVDEKGVVVPAQFSNVLLHPDGSIASATVWFVVQELTANGNCTRTFITGKSKVKVPVTDLSLIKDKTTALLTTSKVGVKILLDSKKFETPQIAEKIPAPLQAIRLRSGKWTGASWLETKHVCTGYTAKITDDGPVFKKVVIRYSFVKPENWDRAGDLFYEVSVRVAAGQEVAFITEDFNLGDPKVYQPPVFKDEQEELMWGWCYWRPQEAPDNFCFSFLAGNTFKPTHGRVIAHNITDPAKGKTNGGYGEVEYSLAYTKNRLDFLLNARNDGEPDMSLIYTLYNKSDSASDILSLLPCFSAHWRNPNILPRNPAYMKQTSDASDIRIYSSTTSDLFFRAPLHMGRREWAVATMCNPKVVTPERDFTVMAGLLRKYGAFPLDKVKDWIVDWSDSSVKTFDTLQNDSQRRYRGVLNSLDESITMALRWPTISERTGINASAPGYASRMEEGLKLLQSGVLTPEERSALRSRIAFLSYITWDDEFLPPRKCGYIWGSLNMPVNVARSRLREASVLLKLGHPQAKAWIEKSATFFKYQVASYFNSDGSPWSNPHYMSILAEPMLQAAPVLAAAGIMKDIKTDFPNFYNYAHFLVDLAQPVDVRLGQRSTSTEGDGYWEKPKLPAELAPIFKDSYPDLYNKMMWASSANDPTPPDLKSSVYPGYGAFLRNNVTTKEESYLAIRFGNFTVDHIHQDAGSVIWYARGVPLAMDFASMYTPRTASSWLHSTLTYNHNEPDTLRPCPGKDTPGCYLYGRSWVDHAKEPNTYLAAAADYEGDNIVEANGTLAAFASKPGADYVRGEARRRWFDKTPYYYRNQDIGSPSPWGNYASFDSMKINNPFTWVRQFAYVKDEKPSGPNYLVIVDDLTGNSEVEPAFNFFSLTSDVKEIGNRRYYLTGQHGLDLDMTVLAPTSGRIQLGEWGHHQGFLIGGNGLDENQKLVRVYGKPDGKGFAVVLYPRKANEPKPVVTSLADGKLVKVVLPDQTHWILLSKDPVTVSDDKVSMTGTSVVVKQWKTGAAEILLLAGGKASCGKLVLESKEAESVKGKM